MKLGTVSAIFQKALTSKPKSQKSAEKNREGEENVRLVIKPCLVISEIAWIFFFC
jgi:hypothetical protein